jgi:UDP:flavonoid glycosyltransferase YjiC (YdhE family)
MTKKKKVLFFPFDLLAHYLRCLVLADQYDKDQYDIYFLHSGSYASFIEAHGYQTFPASTFDAAHVMACAAKFDFSWLEYAVIEKVLKAQIYAIEQLRPDLVIGDVAPTLKMAAEYTKVQYIALMNGYMSPYYAKQRKISRTHPAYSLLDRLPVSMSERFTSYGEKLSFWKIHAPFKRLRRKYKLQAVSSYLWETQGDRNLICDLADLFPQRQLPANYKLIGPLIYQQPKMQPADLLSLLDDAKQTICVCLGSTGNWGSLRFLNEPYFSQFNIIAAGDVSRTLSATHIISKAFVNLPEVLKHTDLLICHGGNGTVNCGIQAEVYMLCLTANFEQEWNVEALENQGLGRSADNFCLEDWKSEINMALSKSRKLVNGVHTD